jgi:hypothetical protein
MPFFFGSWVICSIFAARPLHGASLCRKLSSWGTNSDLCAWCSKSRCRGRRSLSSKYACSPPSRRSIQMARMARAHLRCNTTLLLHVPGHVLHIRPRSSPRCSASEICISEINLSKLRTQAPSNPQSTGEIGNEKP